MIFPDSNRVIYANNVLAQVVCQVKFPTILKISEPQVEFQEKIRSEFPLLNVSPAVEFPPDIPPDMARMVASRMGNVSHFISRDKMWDVSLHRDFLALTCSEYVRWEDFRSRFDMAFRALNEAYAPTFYTRIGLRYQNVIYRERLGLEGVPWRELLRREVAGELDSPEVGPAIEGATRELLINLGDNAQVRLTHGLSQDDAYIVDADFFVEAETEAVNVPSQLIAFNRESGRLIRWAIQDRLHKAMGPIPATASGSD